MNEISSDLAFRNLNSSRSIFTDSISSDFISHARKHFLKEDELDEFIDACHRPLRKSIRINTLKISVNDCLKKLQKYGLSFESIPWCSEGFWVENENSSESNNEIILGNLAEHLQGLFYIQEASSMLPPAALINPNEISNDAPMVLDLAAAPGSKTTQLAAMVGNRGLILANEVSASRVKVLHANLVRCGVSNSCMTQFDGRKLGERLSGQFDFVLLDAPCGGEGTVRKDPSALKDWQLSKVEELATLQKQLILIAYRCLKPGGRLVYSTCTLSPEENQQVAQYLLELTDAETIDLTSLFKGAEKALTDEGFLHILPQTYDSEGFFVAAFIKPNTSQVEHYAAQKNTTFKNVDKKTSQRIQQYYLSHFGFDLTQSQMVMKQRDKEIWLFPTGYDEICDLVRLNRSGIKLAEVYPNKIRSTHEFFCCFVGKINQQKIELSLEQTEDFYKGRNLEIPQHSLLDGEVALMFDGHIIGFGGLKKNKIKNQLPRDLVKDQIRL